MRGAPPRVYKKLGIDFFWKVYLYVYVSYYINFNILSVHIVTCIFIIEIVYVLLNSTKENLFIRGLNMLQAHVILGLNERCTP